MKIALVGIYGGTQREYNPGCFMIGYKTYQALKERIPEAEIHVYSIDSFGGYDGIHVEEEGGIEIRFISVPHQIRFLENELSTYDSLVLGGDNIWSVDKFPSWPFSAILEHFFKKKKRKRSVFLLESKAFLNSKIPVVAVNCVNSVSSKQLIIRNRKRFVNACKRSSYVAVRNRHLKETLEQDFGLSGISQCFDPVIGINPQKLPKASQCLDLPSSGKPKLGIAIRPSFVLPFAEALKTLQNIFEQFDVWFIPFSRFHSHFESQLKIRKIIGSEFHYFDIPLSPVDAFRFIENLDIVFNDTYHGTIAAIIQNKPFLTVRFRAPHLSRRTELFSRLGMEDRSIRICDPRWPFGFRENTNALIKELPSLLENPQRVGLEALTKARAEVEQHFDNLAEVLQSC